MWTIALSVAGMFVSYSLMVFFHNQCYKFPGSYFNPRARWLTCPFFFTLLFSLIGAGFLHLGLFELATIMKQ